MSNHIVRADSRGNLRVISKIDGQAEVARITVPFSDPMQAFARCMAECRADQIIAQQQAIGA
jgi:hypothetical protein